MSDLGEIVSHKGHDVRCVGNPAQKERFSVYFSDPILNDVMIGRKHGNRHFVNWAEVVECAAEQSPQGSKIKRIEVI